jgi:hypothetical protein
MDPGYVESARQRRSETDSQPLVPVKRNGGFFIWRRTKASGFGLAHDALHATSKEQIET